MISFFAKIFSGIATVIVSVGISLGLISAPAQPQVDIAIEPISIVQEQITTDHQDLSTESKANNEQIESTPKENSTVIKTPPAQPAGSATSPTGEEFSSYLWSAGIPDPDLIIRTGGEKRLSGFLTWQSVYSELFFTDTYLPDFSKGEFQDILTEFGARERRMGK